MSSKERCFYIKLDNILSTNPILNQYQMIKASSGPELIRKAITHYGFDNSVICRLQLWSSNTAWLTPAQRIDTLDIIPEEHEFLWLKASIRPLLGCTAASST
jgi:hypothetical protein